MPVFTLDAIVRIGLPFIVTMVFAEPGSGLPSCRPMVSHPATSHCS
jgi:hypothetical protein